MTVDDPLDSVATPPLQPRVFDFPPSFVADLHIAIARIVDQSQVPAEITDQIRQTVDFAILMARANAETLAPLLTEIIGITAQLRSLPATTWVIPDDLTRPLSQLCKEK